MLVDLHAKSSASDGVRVDAETVLNTAKKIGLDGVAFCETLTSSTCRQTLDAAERAGIPAFIGVEIPTDRGILVGFTPDIDEFYFAEEWRQLTEFATPPAHQIVQMFDERGGAVIASRPYDLTIPYNMGDLIFTLDNIHAVEVFNTRCGQVQCDFALEAAKFMGIPTCGGTDPAGGDDQEMGRYATFFDGDLQTQAEFVTALRDSEYWAVQFGETPKSKSTSNRSSSRGSGNRRGRGGKGRRGGKRSGGRRGGRGGRGRSRNKRD